MSILTSCEMATGTDWPTWVPDWTVPSVCSQQFTGLYAAGDTCPEVKYNENDTLAVCGVLIDQVDARFLDTVTEQDAIGAIQTLFRQYWTTDVEGFRRTLYANRFSNRYIPRRESLLSTSASREFVSILNKAVNPTSLGPHVGKFISEFQTMAHGRCFLKTTKGYTGLGLQGVRPGDIICVFLGCNTPMVLRPSSEVEGAFEVIGAAYIDEFSEAQALLGPLPGYISFRYQYNEGTKTFRAAYLDERTQETTLNDPRLGPMPPGWRVKRYPEENARGIYETMDHEVGQVEPTWETTYHDPRLTPEALRKRGVNLQTFRLV